MARADRGSDTELSRALVALRGSAGLRQVDVAGRTALSQARLSRIEGGEALPKPEDIDELVALYRADPEQAETLRRMAGDLRAGIDDSRLVVQRGNTLAMQQRWRRIESEARVIRAYHPAIVLGLLQTPAYAAVAMEEPVGSAAVQSRTGRLSTAGNRRYILVQTEGAVRACVGSDTVMAEQREALIAASRLPTVELGIIPARRAVGVVMGTAFHIYDDAVVVGLEIASATLTEPKDVERFRARFERLAAAAVFGDEAVELIRGLA